MKHRAARFVLLAAFCIDMMFYGLAVSFLPQRAQALGASPVEVGALFAVFGAGLLAGTAPAGRLTDKIGARATLLGGSVLLFCSTMLFALVPGLAWLFVARAAQGAAGAVTWTAGLAMLVRLSPDGERTRMFAWMFTAAGMGTLLGPPAGGLLYSLGGFRLPFLFAAALVLVDGAGRFLFLPAGERGVESQPVTISLFTMVRNRRFAAGMWASMAGAAILAVLDPVIPPRLSTQYGLSTWAIGLVFGGITLSFTLAQPLVRLAVRRIGLERPVLSALVACGLLLPLLGWVNVLILLIAVLLALACAAAFVEIPALELLTLGGQEAYGDTAVKYGAIYATYNLAYSGGLLLGPLLVGSAAGWLGPGNGLVLPGALFLVVALCIGIVLRKGPHQAGSSGQ